MSECLICEHPVSDADVCSDCARTADIALGEVRWLLHELDLATTRQTARAEHVGGASASTPLPFAWDPSDLRWALENTVTTWARVVAAEKPADLPKGRTKRQAGAVGPYCQVCEHESCEAMWHWEPVDVGLVAAWLAGHVEWLRHHPAGHEAIDEITAVVRRAKSAIDVRPARLYAGPCSVEDGPKVCGHDLYASLSSAVVTCPACGRRYDVEQRKAWLMDSARDHLATASEASALCWRMRGDLVTTAMIRGYVRRGKLAPHTVRTERGRDVALYRIGDVLDVSDATRWDEREQRATRKAGAA